MAGKVNQKNKTDYTKRVNKHSLLLLQFVSIYDNPSDKQLREIYQYHSDPLSTSNQDFMEDVIKTIKQILIAINY